MENRDGRQLIHSGQDEALPAGSVAVSRVTRTLACRVLVSPRAFSEFVEPVEYSFEDRVRHRGSFSRWFVQLAGERGDVAA